MQLDPSFSTFAIRGKLAYEYHPIPLSTPCELLWNAHCSLPELRQRSQISGGLLLMAHSLQASKLPSLVRLRPHPVFDGEGTQAGPHHAAGQFPGGAP